MIEFFVGRFKCSLSCEMSWMISKLIGGVLQGSEKKKKKVTNGYTDPQVPLSGERRSHYTYEGWNFNSGNYLFTTDTK